MRRVVVTGMGAATPLAGNLKHTWDRLIKGESGIRMIDTFDASEAPVKIGGLVPRGTQEDQFNAEAHVALKDQRKIDKYILYGVGAADMALEDAGWIPENQEDKDRTGVMIGCGIGGLPKIYEQSIALHEGGYRKVSPFFIPASLINEVSGHVSIKYGFTGPNHAPVTACSTGAHAIGDAARMIMFEDADVMVAGGSEAALCPIGLAGFASARALSRGFNDRPTEASRPWDQERDGFVMGEGAGIVVLEELEHAKKRGAKIYAELKGYGLSGDGYHITAPHPEGRGALRSMEVALKRSNLALSEIGYINAHGTSTPLGDEIEIAAVRRIFDGHQGTVSISSTKSAIGHLLGAAGCVEAIFSILAMNEGILPPTLNLHNPSENCRDFDLVPLKAKEKKINHVLSNSFGFGGTNASLVFSRFTS